MKPILVLVAILLLSGCAQQRKYETHRTCEMKMHLNGYTRNCDRDGHQDAQQGLNK